MKTIKLGSSSLEIPVVAVGCMRMSGLDVSQAETFVNEAIDMGANFFDHAYKLMFSQSNYGYGSVVVVGMVVCIAVIAVIYVKVLGAEVLNND